jgi:hypothetical protein
VAKLEEWLLPISLFILVILVVFNFWADFFNNQQGIDIGDGSHLSYAIIPALLMIPTLFVLGYSVNKYSRIMMIMCFAAAFLVVPIIVWEVSIKFNM